MAQSEKEATAPPTGQYAFKWTKEQTEEFIRLRVEHQHLFTGAKYTASNGYRIILDKLGIGGRVTHAQAKKKWSNLRTKYKSQGCVQAVDCFPAQPQNSQPEERDEDVPDPDTKCVGVESLTAPLDLKKKKEEEEEEEEEAATASPTEQYTFKWTKEQTEEFIRLRVEHQHLFTGAKYTASSGYRIILDKLGIGGRVTHAQAKKKWSNLMTKYKECKCPASGQSSDGGKPSAATWPLFTVMDEALRHSAAASPPCTSSSSPHDKPAASTREEREEEEEEEERIRDGGRGEKAGQRGGRKRGREREDPFLTLLKEDMHYQREADERREAEARERSDRFFALLERLAEKLNK